jgi:hypothetical protein
LVVLGIILVYLSLAATLAVVFGRVAARADREEVDLRRRARQHI